MKKDKITRILLIEQESDTHEFQQALNKISTFSYTVEKVSTYLKGKPLLLADSFDICFVGCSAKPDAALTFLLDVTTHKCPTPIIMLMTTPDEQHEFNYMNSGAADCLFPDQLEPNALQKTINHQIFRANFLKKSRDSMLREITRDRLSSVSLLASSLAHEIGTPLGIMRGRAEYLELLRKDDPTIKKNLTTIIAQIDRISHLIKSLLNLVQSSRPGSSSGMFLQDLISEITELLEHEFRKNNIEFINESNKLPSIELPEIINQFQQVFLNLLVISIQAIETSIRRGRSTNHFIRISVDYLDNFIKINLSDSGCPISEIEKGIGLGLTISHHIVESWGGKIKVECKEIENCRICLLVPK